MQDRGLQDDFIKVTESASDVIGVFDVEGRALYVNAQAQALRGPANDDEPFQRVHPGDRERIRAEYAEVVRTGKARRLELRLVSPDGGIRLMQAEANPVRDSGGQVVAVLGIGREVTDDINERRRIEEELRVRADVLKAIYEHAPIGIAVTDEAGRYVRANPSFLRMLGYTEEELYRLTGWDVIHKEDAQASRKLRDELFAGKRENFAWERRYVRKNGEVVWARVTVALIRDGDAAPRYAMALVEDITQRRTADAAIRSNAESLQALTRRLVELQETQRRDLSRELHDRVGQTLTAMRINMDMIRTRLTEHDDALIRSRNNDSLELIESAFRAVENVMYELRPPMIDEYGLIAPLQWYAKKFTARTGIRVEIRGDESWRCGPQIELALFRIAQEALNNVARHAKARRVAIELLEIGPQVVLAIEDDGVGFNRDSDRTDKAGYGFITMRERAEAVGGIFEAHSQSGKGTRITVSVSHKP